MNCKEYRDHKNRDHNTGIKWYHSVEITKIQTTDKCIEKNDPISLTKQFTKYQRDGRLKRVLSTGCWCGVDEEKTYWSNLRIPLHKTPVSYNPTCRI